MRRALLPALACLFVLVPGAAGRSGAGQVGGELVEVVVGLHTPPLAKAVPARTTASTARARLSLRSGASVSYLRGLAAEQRTLEHRIEAAIPAARVRWRYRITIDAIAVVLQRSQLARLAKIPGVARVYPTARYGVRLDRSPGLIGAPQLWGPGLATAGQGMKIGIIDQGIDPSHPFFNPAGYAYPPGFPKGQRAYTTPKIIVARVFAPPRVGGGIARSKRDFRPFDPPELHGTHVAGIAAGDNGVVAKVGGASRTLSGVAPKAYLGNYRALTVPTPGSGTDGNAPEIAAAIESAVADGMDVINLSIGEPEIEPKRDLVVAAINGAADAGVVPVVAAGNDFSDFGAGSVGSPGSAAKAITVAAATKDSLIASFSSGGPTPVSLQLKPDVTAPGVNIVSSLPASQGTWGSLEGTSMASPHVAGAAALLRQRHPTWTVAQVKSALAQTGAPIFDDATRRVETPATREGGGMIDLPKADRPLIFAQPSSTSFGLVRPGQTVTQQIELTDAGDGAGDWTVSAVAQTADPAVAVTTPASVAVPGQLTVSATVGAAARDLDLTGFVVLRRGADVRRIAYWLTVSPGLLASEPHTTLTRPGTYHGNTRGKPARVSAYRYPRGGANRLPGPEQVFRVTLTRPVANFGVAITSGPRGIEPRIVFAGDESHLVGYPGLPLDINPYTSRFGQEVRVAAAIRPAPGTYDIVFDTASRAGAFTFRYWVDDLSPPALRLATPRPKQGSTAAVVARDGASGIDPESIAVRIDGARIAARYDRRTNRIAFTLAGLSRGRHSLVVVAADYEETKNMEDVPLILPNTAVLRTRLVIR